MKTIHKICLCLYSATKHSVLLPVGAKILSAHAQDEAICLWYEVQNIDDSLTLEERFITTYPAKRW